MQAEEEDRAPINQLADKAFRTAVFGLLFWPLQLYVLYLLACLYAEDGTVSRDRRWKVWAAVLLNMPMMGVIVLPLMWLMQR